ncbi:PREDICTED: phospholipase A2 large subunit-like [Rhagoletis zephyria]|uniref:phospholipase A2 large subunit-like n=1 Tax=Rhagoletis zephyria TaxID=28612 RepID=UPI0008116D1B|nr:PREDICTED: phospholipase A2 large subunit-like [Rhagoletis zephyria]
MYCLKFGFSIFIILILATIAYAFEDESIFEDEDIYKQALPPVPHTGITVPGTKWCGPGNTAANYDDLGTQRETDTCCRAHDHCEEILEPRQTLYGLNNTDLFPILKCTCEQTFLNCLQAINDMMSNTLGRVYFGTRKKCFANGYPIVRCRQHQNGTFRRRCIRYEVGKRPPKIWQFYDMPFYSYGR